MKKNNDREPHSDDLRPEYDAELIRRGVRGKYVERYKKGTNLVFLAPDVAAVFPDSDAVNEALRLLTRIARQAVSGRA